MKINFIGFNHTFKQPYVKLVPWSLLILLLLKSSFAAAALCTMSSGTAALGTQNSIQAASALTTTGTTGMSCNAFQLSILNGAVFTGTLTGSTNGLKLVKSNSVSGNTISYQAYANSNHTVPFVMNQPVDYIQQGLLGLIFIGGAAANVPIYIQTTAGANLEAGTYTDTLTFHWTYTLCTGVGIGGLCVLGGWETNSGNSQVQVTLTVTNICFATAPDVNFGSYALINQFSSINQNTTAQCTLNANYQTYFDNGSNYVSPWRRMSNGTGAYIQYNINYPNTTTPWLSSNPVSGVGSGAVTNVPYTATANPAQTTPIAGAYTDRVVFVISY